MIKKAKIYIFDEISNSLDNQLEGKLVRNIIESMDKMIIVITYSHNNLKHCDYK